MRKPILYHNLTIERCPHCSIDNPNLASIHTVETKTHDQKNQRFWGVFSCKRCGGLVTAFSRSQRGEIEEYFPDNTKVDENIPDRAKSYLEQALISIHSPAGAVMLAASAIDSMLKEKGYTEGTLYKRIKQAAADNLLTKEMETWAHEVRLEANDQRHSDVDSELPDEGDAKRTIDFSQALAQFLFVLPARIQRGIEKAQNKNSNIDNNETT